MPVPNIFGTATSAIPLSQLDTNFATPVTIGNTAVQLGNTVTSFGNVTLTNVTISSGNVSVSTATVGAGSNTAPSITTTGDTNTGIFFPAADTIAFSEGGAESMRIDSSGNVGIGTASPSSKLHVAGTGTQSITVERTDASTAGLFQLISGNSTNVINASTAKPVSFEINGSERMRIDSSGNLLVGTTTAYGTNSRFSLFVANNTSHGMTFRPEANAGYRAINFNNSAGSGNVGFIDCTTSATTYSTSSDYRLKHDIQPMTGALAKVAALKPVTYKWKVDGSDGQGFIAHELAEVAPYAVSGEKDGEQMQGVDYGKLTPILTAALQEAIAKIEVLEARIAALEAK